MSPKANKADFCCAAAQEDFKRYYMNQAGGGGMPVFAGSRRQSGHGIGSWFANLFRRWAPVVAPAAQSFARELGNRALQAGTRIGSDLVSGEKGFAESIKERLGQAVRGEGYKKKRAAPYAHKPRQKVKRARRVHDFFAS